LNVQLEMWHVAALDCVECAAGDVACGMWLHWTVLNMQL